MLLSIIVPVYNVEKYLSRCIDSLLDQGDFIDYEIILVDDGSTDSSGAICDEYVVKHEKISVIHQKNNGAASARNRGIIKSNGQFLMFVDADDYIKSDCLFSLFSIINRYQLDILSFNFLYHYDDNHNTINDVILVDAFPVKGEDYLIKSFQNNTIQMMPVKCIYLSGLIKENGILFREGYGYEDEEWVPRVLCSGNRVMQCDELVYAYCIRNTSISRNPETKKKGALDLINNCWSLYSFASSIANTTLKHLLENNICTLVLSAAYSGRLFHNRKEILSLLSKLSVCNKNRHKIKLFKANTRLYYWVNTFSKRIVGIRSCFLNGFFELKRIKEYGDQQFHKISRMILVTNPQKKQLTNHSFSIISSNCNGAVITSELREQFRTPTVNLFFSPSDYVKFSTRLEYYLSCELVEKKNNFEMYPVGILDDIYIHFMHYHSFDEAKEKWDIRKKRVNFDNIFFMLTMHNGCTDADVNDFFNLPYKNKIVFTNKIVVDQRFVFIEDDKDKPEVGILTDFVKPLGHRKYDKYFDYVKWLNEGEQI